MAEPLLDVEVAAYLKSVGFGDLYSDPGRKQVVFVGEEPASIPTDSSITVLEDGGGTTQVTGLVESRAFRVRVQGTNYEATKAVAQRVHRALDNQQGILSNVRVARVLAETNPIHLGKNTNGMHQFTQSFTALVGRIEPTTGPDFKPQP